MYVLKAAETTFVRKIRTFNVDEIDTGRKGKCRQKIITKSHFTKGSSHSLETNLMNKNHRERFTELDKPKFAYGRLVLGSSPFSLMTQLPQKIKLTLEVFKIN